VGNLRSGLGGVERRSVLLLVGGEHHIFVEFDDFAITKDAKFTKAA
jgi:hypothetical protein